MATLSATLAHHSRGTMRAFSFLCLTLLLACSRAPRTVRTDRNIIRAEEIAGVQATNAHDIVAKLRSEFLKARGPVSASRGRAVETPAVTVFVDGVERGPAESVLRLIPATDVQEIRLYRAADATTKYGSRHSGGVIDVTIKRARP
jgi:outer membrane cobalamin receptor